MRDSDAETYEKHAEELVRFATLLVGPGGADDLVSGAVLRAFSSPAWPSVTEPRAYLYRTLVNEARQLGGRRSVVCAGRRLPPVPSAWRSRWCALRFSKPSAVSPSASAP
ncbi:MAG TPA: hypothetical protein VG078_04990 [Acidimicrobiales bacterium]|nr:hypothetical protein [Acidimicrobiales bacterium]